MMDMDEARSIRTVCQQTLQTGLSGHLMLAEQTRHFSICDPMTLAHYYHYCLDHHLYL